MATTYEPHDFTNWCWRLRKDYPGARVEIYTVPGWAPRLKKLLIDTYGLRGVIQHSLSSLRIKGPINVEKAVLLFSDDEKLRALAGEYRLACRSLRDMGHQQDLVRRLIKEDEARWPV